MTRDPLAGKAPGTRTWSALLVAVLLSGVALLPGAVPAAAQPADSKLRLSVEEFTPRAVTGAEQQLTVRGSVHNTSDHRIDNLAARIQLGQRLSTESEIRDALVEAPQTEAARSQFVPIARSLAPGQSARLQLTVPLGPGPNALNITEQGVFPLLINVNGRPQDEGDARLTALNTLLPVLAPPGGDPGQARPPAPVPTTMLWPIVDAKPRVLRDGPDTPTVLSDDRLAESLAPGGRLHSLVDAPQTAGTEQISSALCFAIDPDLLATVDAMTRGYQVRNSDGSTRPGAGAGTARRWLDSVRALTAGRCVFPLPFADADLAALTRADPDRTGMSGLMRLSLGGGQVLSTLLAPLQPLGGVSWPDGGTLDPRTVQELARSGTNTLVVDPARLGQLDESVETAPLTLDGVRGPTGEGVTALPYDSVVSDAFGSRAAPAAGTTASADPRALATQNGLAALAFRAAFNADDGGNAGAPVLIAPPRRWEASDQELRALLRNMSDFAGRGLLRPVSLQDAMASPAPGSTGLNYLPGDASAELSHDAMRDGYWISGAARDLLGALRQDATAQVTPADVVNPVHYGVLRAASTAWRGKPGAVQRAVFVARRQLAGLTDQVTVSTSGRISLASEASPLPVSINNGLPVSIAVRVKFSEVPGLKMARIQEQRVPANSGISRLFPAEVSRSGRFSVDVTLTTPSGGRLGPSARFELASSQYGGIMLVVTGTAGAALVLLVGLRIYRRMRSDRPQDGQQEQLQR